jgi:diaminopropionate ammonia-lyase
VSDPESKAALGLDERSRIFVINTETATDTARYEAIVGSTPDAVAGSA